jgi:chromosome segregation ATPase
MFRFMRSIVKWGVIGGLSLTALFAIVGGTRLKTAVWSVRDHIRSNVDELVDTRTALEHEVKKLMKEYPERIAEIQFQLHQIDGDIVKCSRQLRKCEETASVAKSDMDLIRTRLDRADADADGVGPVVIEFRAKRLDRSEALSEAAEAAEYMAIYNERSADLRSEQRLLTEEKLRLAGELAGLQHEYADFQAEVDRIGRDIDSLERKEKLVQLAERRNGEREDIFADRASSLNVLKERIVKKKLLLDQKIKAVHVMHGAANEYEARAELRRRLTDRKASPSSAHGAAVRAAAPPDSPKPFPANVPIVVSPGCKGRNKGKVKVERGSDGATAHTRRYPPLARRR